MLTIYNTLTKKKESFKPLNPPFVGIYVCGPTVYDDPHLGHAKSYVSFDIIVRFLRASGYRVRYVQNITDVGHLLGETNEGEDRILKKAQLEHLEPVEIAQKYERHYFRDMDALNLERPDISSRATGHIPEMIELIQVLLDKGYAYEVHGNIYFEVSTFSEYGKLSGRKVEDMISGTRIDAMSEKRHPADFALWKKADPEHLMQWNSPWGKGFPGWHLECSVMAQKYLGETIDIHGGGLDNQFPHHECEIAQSEAANGKPFVRYFMHNNMVTLNSQKMSKSLGNFITLTDLFDRYGPMTVRFFILQGHYRSPQDFSDTALEAASKGFNKLRDTVINLKKHVDDGYKSEKQVSGQCAVFRTQFFDAMNNDFSTATALSVLFDLSRFANSAMSGDDLESINYALALFEELGEEILGLQFAKQGDRVEDSAEDALMEIIISMRQKVRAEKNWKEADRIRDLLAVKGISILDGVEGSTWKKAVKN
ncbi:cysteine--tRNA ligase [bacterium]|nr:cysteine--tRNA ligase [bacterium]